MSLLNDALRDLEKRRDQGGQQGPSIPAGLAAEKRPSRGELAGVSSAVVIAVALVLGGGYWAWNQWFSERSLPMLADESASQEEPVPEPPVETVHRVEHERPEDVEPVAEPMPGDADTEASTPEVVELERSDRLQGKVEETEETATAEPEPEPVEAAEASEPDSSAGESEPEPEPEPEPEQVTADAEPETESEPEPERAQVREMTAQERERQLAREIEELLENGQVHQAEEKLRAHLVLDSDAPRARAAMATHYLRRDDAGAARHWVPESVAELYPELRMIRARIALNDGDREDALQWLASDPPPVARHTDYHSMMATLYQQTDQPAEAARVWGQLLEVDDAQARWWAGLGIALEAQGRQEGAVSAFMQATQLPGLPQALREYVEQRLASQG